MPRRSASGARVSACGAASRDRALSASPGTGRAGAPGRLHAAAPGGAARHQSRRKAADPRPAAAAAARRRCRRARCGRWRRWAGWPCAANLLVLGHPDGRWATPVHFRDMAAMGGRPGDVPPPPDLLRLQIGRSCGTARRSASRRGCRSPSVPACCRPGRRPTTARCRRAPSAAGRKARTPRPAPERQAAFRHPASNRLDLDHAGHHLQRLRQPRRDVEAAGQRDLDAPARGQPRAPGSTRPGRGPRAPAGRGYAAPSVPLAARCASRPHLRRGLVERRHVLRGDPQRLAILPQIGGDQHVGTVAPAGRARAPAPRRTA